MRYLTTLSHLLLLFGVGDTRVNQCGVILAGEGHSTQRKPCPSYHFVHHKSYINPSNAELNPICYLLALLGAHHFLHVSRIRVNTLRTGDADLRF